MVAGVKIGYGATRTWQQKWRDVTLDLETIEETLSKPAENNVLVRRQLEDFFKDCRELADWLKQSAGRGEAMAYVYTDPDLRLCNGLAQTIKHHTRRPSHSDSDPITARIASVSSGHGVRAEIEWSSFGGVKGTEDALDLSRRCFSAWERFFQQYGLDPSG